MPDKTGGGVNPQGNSVSIFWPHATPLARCPLAQGHLGLDTPPATHTSSASSVQYTTYSNGNYSYSNAPSTSNNGQGSHYYSSGGGGGGFYTQNGGKSNGGYSYYQNSQGQRSYK